MIESATMPQLAETRADPHEFPCWLMAMSWLSLLLIVLSHMFPGMKAPMNIGSGLGVLSLLIVTIRSPRWFWTGSRLQWWILAFLGSGLLSSLAPHWFAESDMGAISKSLHIWWNTLQAATAAGLCAVLIRTRRDLWILCSFVLIALLLVSFQGVLLWLSSHAAGTGRPMSNIKGNINRYAYFLLSTGFLLWLILFGVRLREMAAQGWVRWGHVLLALVAPLCLLRKSGLRVDGLDLNVIVIPGWAIYLLYWFVAAGCVFALRRGGRLAFGTWYLALVLCLVNQVQTGSRMAMLLTLLTVAAMALIAWRVHLWENRHKLAVVILLAAIVLAGVVYNQRHRWRDLGLHGRQRIYIWYASSVLYRQHLAIGAGTGEATLRDNFPLPLPAPDDLEVDDDWVPKHAHNQILQYGISQGTVGIVLFFALWGSVTAAMIHHVRMRRDGPEEWSRRTLAWQGLLVLVILQLNGLVTCPLQRSVEIIYWLVPALVLAALRDPEFRE